MIQISCDRCDKPIDVPESHAGGKYACPQCGDINRVPSVESSEPPMPASGPAPSGPKRDRAAEAGFPPDSGDEQTVMRVRRCWFRSRPLAFSAAALVCVGGIVGAIWSATSDHAAWVLYLWAIGSLAGLGTIAWWWVDRFGSSIMITNKRTVQHTGLLRRATSEVVHDNIRNIQVDQSFWQRLWGVGRLGISSSGQDGVEIEINHLPGPDKLREIVDLYRPL